MRSYSISSIRILLIIANIFGAVMSAILFISFFFLVGTMKDALGVASAQGVDYYGYTLTGSIFALIAFFLTQSMCFGIYLTNYLIKHSDEDLFNNRFIIMALSLSVGGLFTPFILSSMPNTNSESTDKPRYTVSRAFSVMFLVSGTASLFTFLLINLIQDGISFNSLFDSSINSGTAISIAVVAISGLSILYGFITTILFYQRNAGEKYEQGSKMLNLFGYVNTIFVTINLIILFIYSIIRIIGLILDIFSSSRENIFFGFITAIINMLYIIVTIYVMNLTIQTIKGIWNKNNVASFTVFSKLATSEDIHSSTSYAK